MGIHYRDNLDSDDLGKAVFELQHENAALREQLYEQWEANHVEHCSRRWPHAVGEQCMWPLPEALVVQASPQVVDERQDAASFPDDVGD